MSAVVRLQITHRNRLFRECLTTALSRSSQFQVTHADWTGEKLINVEKGESPHLILVDVQVPLGADQLAQMIREHSENAKILLLVSPESQDRIIDCISAGAHGCFLEESSLAELQDAIDTLLNGGTFCSPRIVDSMFAQLASLSSQAEWRERAESVSLTPRELEILHLVADGLGNKQIASQLSLSLYTVKNHLHNILEKLQVENRFQAVDFARGRRWLTKPGVVGGLKARK